MSDRIASFTHTTSILSNNIRLQTNYARTQTQIASGFVADRYEGIAVDSSRLLNLESDFDRISQQTENVQLAIDRTELIYDALGAILEQSQGFNADLSSTVSGFGLQGQDLVNNAQTKLNQVAGNLNTQLANRYLFSGATTQTRPVDLSDPAWGGQTYTAPGPSVADFNYYQGDDYIQTVEASDGFYVDYGVNANHPSFEKLIRAYDLIINTPNDPATLQEAQRILEEALDEIAILQASVSQDAQTLTLQRSANEEDVLLLETQIANIREVDLAEASTRLAQLETQLEASYSVTAKMLQLSIVDFIR